MDQPPAVPLPGPSGAPPRTEPLLQRFATPFQVLLTLGLYAQLAVLGGLAAAPGVWAALEAVQRTEGWPPFLRVVVGCVAAFGAYFAYALTVPFVVSAFRVLTFAGTPVGRFPYYSISGLRWASYNALILLVRYTCINFLRVTPFINLFHRMMGMRVGRRVQINTAVIGDSNLIQIGDDSVIGGDVTLVAHAAERGQLVTEPVRIGSRVTVGLMAVILPGVEIGDGAVIAAGAILPKGTRVGPGEVWGGVPARKLGEKGRRREEEPEVTRTAG